MYGIQRCHRTSHRVASRILGSPDLYAHEEREAEQSINFITCHDGFTLNDLVSYNHKHNDANGENNRDGSDDNLNRNCGAEGPTDDPTVEAVRNRQVKNFFALTLLAVGTPMVLMGDEVRRTQKDAYCQDSDTSWFDWSLLERHGELRRRSGNRLRFVLDAPQVDPAKTAARLDERARNAERCPGITTSISLGTSHES
jgi:isoamylase